MKNKRRQALVAIPVDYVRVNVEFIRESEEQRRMQIRFNHLARVYCVHAIQSGRLSISLFI